MLKIFYRDAFGKLVPTTCLEISQLDATVKRGRDDDADRLDGRNDQTALRDFQTGMSFQKEVNFILEKTLLKVGGDVAMCLTHPDAVDGTPDVEIYLPSTKRRIYIEIQTSNGWFDYRKKNATYQRVVDELNARLAIPEKRTAALHAFNALDNIEAMGDAVGIHVKGLKTSHLAGKGELYLLQQVGRDTFVIPSDLVTDPRAPRSPMPWPKNDLNVFLPRDFLKGMQSLREFLDKTFPSRVYKR